jgi:hypothetical protein
MPNDDYQRRLRATLLSDAIPATVYAAGANDLSSASKNLNLETLIDNMGNIRWPRKGKFWLHSDIKNVCYMKTHGFYEYIADKGNNAK